MVGGIASAQNLAPPAVAHLSDPQPRRSIAIRAERPGDRDLASGVLQEEVDPVGSEPEGYGVVTNTEQRPAAFGAGHRRVPRTRSHAHFA
jgi:hypothetical protein